MRPLSARNPRAKRLARLVRQRSFRAGEGVFVVEGPTLLADAVAAGLVVQEVFMAADAAERPGVLAAVDAAVAAGAEAFVVTEGLGGLTETVTPNGVAAIVATPPSLSVAEHLVAARDRVAAPFVLVLVEVADPGNAGTLVRAAEAAGVEAVVFAGPAVDPWSPKCVRASAGSLFRVRVLVEPDSTEALAQLGKAGVTRVGTRVNLGDTPAYDRVDLTGPVAIVLGNEAHGLAEAADEALDQVVTIPMRGGAESLNVAMAGSVLCFEVLRQRRHADAGTDAEIDLSAPWGSGQGSPQ